jgi:outer membrane lipoprotein SlyB
MSMRRSSSLFPFRRGRLATWFTSASIVVATAAAMTLAACGPRDEAPRAGGAAGLTAPADPSPRPTGQPVPTVGQPVPTQSPAPAPPVAVAPAYPPTAPAPLATPAPTVAAAPATTYPADRAPDYRPAPAPARAAAPKAVASNRVGEITRIEPIRTRPQGSGAGAVVGGVLGAVVGNQFGHGLGRAALTGAGAVGGALAGNNVERNYKEGVSGYRVVIRLDNGRTRTFNRTEVGHLHVGDRVRLDANSFHRA